MLIEAVTVATMATSKRVNEDQAIEDSPDVKLRIISVNGSQSDDSPCDALRSSESPKVPELRESRSDEPCSSVKRRPAERRVAVYGTRVPYRRVV